MPGQPVSVRENISRMLDRVKVRGELTAVHEVDFVKAASNFLNMAESSRHVVKVGLSRVANVLVLPVGEAVGKTAPHD